MNISKWKSGVDLQPVHLAAGSVKIPGYSIFVYMSPYPSTLHDVNMPFETNLFQLNANLHSAGRSGA